MSDLNLNCFDRYPELKTSRLTLRRILPQDAKRIFEMRSNANTNRYILRNEMTDASTAKDLVDAVNEGYVNKQALAFAGLLRDQKQIIGTCGFNRIDHLNNRAEIGGELFVDYWGKRIALEAVHAIISYGFKEMNLHAIEAKVLPQNRGAIAILNQLGFEKEAHFKEFAFFNSAYHDLCVYTLFQDSFNA
jgi:ribosomal-protein-alanine N-acetyltransferase